MTNQKILITKTKYYKIKSKKQRLDYSAVHVKMSCELNFKYYSLTKDVSSAIAGRLLQLQTEHLCTVFCVGIIIYIMNRANKIWNKNIFFKNV